MQRLKDPLFLGVNFLNIRIKETKAPMISVRVNLQRDDVIYAANIKSRMEVIGYEDPETGLFVTPVEGVDSTNVYHTFRLEAIKYARKELERFLEEKRALNEEEYEKLGYKPLPILTNLLYKCLSDRQDLYSDLQKQVNLITSRKLPRVNEYLLFVNDEEPDFPVTARVPYNNPKTVELSEDDKQIVDTYLDVFFDEYNKYAFSWYLGAALLNIPLYDDRVSKLAIVSSSHGGSGKSTLVNSMVDALFTPNYREIKDEFDSFFFTSNKFGVSSLSCKRMSVYSEAKFNNDPASSEHNFSGMNVSVIKSLITEGYVSSEAKFGDRAMERLSGFHMVLTNHVPVITKQNEAMNRRILPLMIKPTKMTTKAKELDLWGKQRLEQFVNKHAEKFAAYFVQAFLKDEYAFADVDYDHTDYVLDINDSQEALEEQEKNNRKTLELLKAQGVIRVISELGKQERVDVKPLIDDIITCVSSDGDDELHEHIRLEGNILYLDGSKPFLLRYGNYGTMLRKQLKELYNAPMKKYHKRMFMIPFDIKVKQ